MQSVKRWRWLDGVWLALWVIYVLAGTSLAPFHGDEATTIWMSKDFVYTVEGDWSRLRYSDPPVSAEEQHLRLITGSLVKHGMGLAWTLAGFSVDEINEQWHWGFDWMWNVENGHYPDDELLRVSRYASALMLGLSVIVLFGIAWQAGGRPVAYLTSLIYALNPVVLLNGRRAMFEGGLLLFSLLVVLVGLSYVKRPSRKNVLLLGVVSGLAVSAKHPGVFSVLGVYVGIGFYGFMNTPRWKIPVQLLVAGGIAFATFYTLNPVWWDTNPLARTEIVLEARTNLLAGQTAAFGGYEDFTEQTIGFVRQTFSPEPQYYEVDGWQVPLAESIQEYERSLFGGVRLGSSVVVALLWMTLVMLGLAHGWRTGDYAYRYVIGSWGAVNALVAWWLTPIEWQRYYLLMMPIVALFSASGMVWIGQRFRGRHAARPLDELPQDEQGVA